MGMGRGGDVEVLGPPAHHEVANATADEIGDMAGAD